MQQRTDLRGKFRGTLIAHFYNVWLFTFLSPSSNECNTSWPIVLRTSTYYTSKELFGLPFIHISSIFFKITTPELSFIHISLLQTCNDTTRQDTRHETRQALNGRHLTQILFGRTFSLQHAQLVFAALNKLTGKRWHVHIRRRRNKSFFSIELITIYDNSNVYRPKYLYSKFTTLDGIN